MLRSHGGACVRIGSDNPAEDFVLLETIPKTRKLLMHGLVEAAGESFANPPWNLMLSADDHGSLDCSSVEELFLAAGTGVPGGRRRALSSRHI